MAGTYTMTGYLYNADGIRVSKGTITSWSCDPATSGFFATNDYILGQGNEQMSESTMNGDGSTLVWEHTNVWAGGRIIATYAQDNIAGQGQNSLLHFYLDDPLGSRRVQTDYAGVVEKTCQSLPFGDGETCLTTPTEHLFTGKERDTESGNDYFGARYYSSALGRFMTPDWSAKVEPVPYAKLDDPQSLNLYAYVLNNPLALVDLDGHVSCQEAPSLCAAVRDSVSSGGSIQDGWANYNQAQLSNAFAGAVQNAGGGGPDNGQRTVASSSFSLYLGNQMVNGHFSVDQGKTGYGASIDATPGNCDQCRWAQVVTRTGPGDRGGPFTDRGKGDTGPDYIAGSSTFDDRPFTWGNTPGTFTAVAVLGNIDQARKTFQSIGAFTWGYGMNSKGNVYPKYPSGTTSAQAINVLRKDSPAWNIH